MTLHSKTDNIDNIVHNEVKRKHLYLKVLVKLHILTLFRYNVSSDLSIYIPFGFLKPQKSYTRKSYREILDLYYWKFYI